MESIFKKGQKMLDRQRTKKRKIRARKGEHQGQRRRKRCSTEEDIIPAACGEVTPEQIFLKDPCWKRGKVCQGRSDREELLWTDCSSHSPSPCAAKVVELVSKGLRLSLGKGEERCCFDVWLFVFPTQKYLFYLTVN